MFMIVFTGFIVDSLLIYFHVLLFRANPFYFPLSPPWMIALWINFSMTLYACFLKFLKNTLVLSMLFFTGFAFSYYAGIQLGAGIFLGGNAFCLLVGAIWGILLPLILRYYYLKWGIKISR